MNGDEKMKSKAILMALAMMTTALAGCTGTDGVTEVDEDALNELIQDNLQDFINNTTVVVNQDFHYHNNTTIDNTDNSVSNVNGSGTAVGSSSYHATAGTSAPESSTIVGFDNSGGFALIVRSDAYSNDYHSIYAPIGTWYLDGVKVCVGTGTSEEAVLVDFFGANSMSLEPVNVGDSAEAANKLQSGECEAITSDGETLSETRASLPGNLSDDGTWIAVVVSDSGWSGYEVLEIIIHQEPGTSTRLLGFRAQINVTGECVGNCAGNASTISEVFTSEVWISECPSADYYTCGYNLNDPSFIPAYPFWGEAVSSGLSACEFGMSKEIKGVGPMFGAGLECEHTITTVFHFEKGNTNGEYDGYEFSWGDWSYIAYWESAPVTMHE